MNFRFFPDALPSAKSVGIDCTCVVEWDMKQFLPFYSFGGTALPHYTTMIEVTVA